MANTPEDIEARSRGQEAETKDDLMARLSAGLAKFADIGNNLRNSEDMEVTQQHLKISADAVDMSAFENVGKGIGSSMIAGGQPQRHDEHKSSRSKVAESSPAHKGPTNRGPT